LTLIHLMRKSAVFLIMAKMPQWWWVT